MYVFIKYSYVVCVSEHAQVQELHERISSVKTVRQVVVGTESSC